MWTISGDKLGLGSLTHFSIDRDRSYYSTRLCCTDPLTHSVILRAQAEFSEMMGKIRLDPEGTCPSCLAVCGVTRDEIDTLAKLREL